MLTIFTFFATLHPYFLCSSELEQSFLEASGGSWVSGNKENMKGPGKQKFKRFLKAPIQVYRLL